MPSRLLRLQRREPENASARPALHISRSLCVALNPKYISQETPHALESNLRRCCGATQPLRTQWRRLRRCMCRWDQDLAVWKAARCAATRLLQRVRQQGPSCWSSHLRCRMSPAARENVVRPPGSAVSPRFSFYTYVPVYGVFCPQYHTRISWALHAVTAAVARGVQPVHRDAGNLTAASSTTCRCRTVSRHVPTGLAGGVSSPLGCRMAHPLQRSAGGSHSCVAPG